MSKTDIQEWISRRTKAVMDVYSAFDCLAENGIELISPTDDMQIPCPFHPDTRPSARYYAMGGRDGRFHCFKCKYHLDSINLFAKFNNYEFMKALSELERRFRIKIPLRPDAPEIKDPVDRGSDYISPAWSDVPRFLKILEDKLARIRYKVPMQDFIKFCRVLDSVQWDIDHNGEQTKSMIDILGKVRVMMEEVEERSVNASLDDI
jgi:hypothetical protein